MLEDKRFLVLNEASRRDEGSVNFAEHPCRSETAVVTLLTRQYHDNVAFNAMNSFSNLSHVGEAKFSSRPSLLRRKKLEGLR